MRRKGEYNFISNYGRLFHYKGYDNMSECDKGFIVHKKYILRIKEIESYPHEP